MSLPRIAVDAMGGDEGVRVMVEGAALARRRHDKFKFLLVGDETRIKAALESHPGMAGASEILHSDDVVGGDELPSRALRRAKTTSMGLAVNAVKQGDAGAAVSAGNTGALMAMSKLALRTMPGLDRPALAALLLPLLIPVPVYRKIHKFHHTHNRRDHHTSTLDGYVVGDEPGYFKRVWIGLLWYLGVFAGGYFIHGVISILLFLFMPPVLARKISPAFENWSWSDQISSILIFAAGIGFHAGFWMLLGQDAWIAALGRPLLFFAWIYSLLVYIYHYRTTYGDQVVYNVRSVSAHGFFRWWLLNFNHHRVHHRYPTLPWHMLPDEPADLPDDFQRNENVDNIGQAIRQQLRGPQIFVEPKDER